MNSNKIIYDSINGLSFEQNIMFALACINRLKHLPQVFINSETYGIEYLNGIIPKDKIENILNEIINKIYYNQIKINEIDADMEILEKLLLDDDIESGIEKQLFFCYVVIVIHILEYIKENKKEYIELCSDNMIEIVDYIKCKEYETKNNLEDYYILDEKMEKYLEQFCADEVKKEIEIIKIIKSGNKEMLNEYIKNNEIEYNV
ncbi:MAG: hypothetical protein LBK13_07335 [Spirochaetales bacterium]|jgi:hypothetical protein|nr:hypothetical protein [Spirochaetales bacterium]